MGSLTIRNIEDELKLGLRVRGAQRGASMEDEARSILRAVLKANLSLEQIGAPPAEPARPAKGESAWDMIKQLREKYGTFDLELPERTDMAPARSIFDE
jgi:plasmid stability protein